MMRAGRLQLGLGLLGAALLAILVVLGIAMARGVGGLAEGRTGGDLGQASDFTLPQFDGESFVLADYADQPVFLYFWASWCIPCEEEAPLIEALWPEYRDRGWTFLGVNIWDLESDARRFVERHGLTFPLARDEDGEVYLDYGVQGLPTAFFLAPGLEMYARYDGLLSEETLRGLLDEVEVADLAQEEPLSEQPGRTPPSDTRRLSMGGL
ncbi:MAG: TlpA disulfide reductase family protein [Gemmatimonadota bacterium]